MLIDDAAILTSDQLHADSVLQPFNAFDDPLGLSYHGPKTKLQNVGAGDPSLTILIDHGSHAVLPTIDRLQLEWLTRGVDPGVGRF